MNRYILVILSILFLNTFSFAQDSDLGNWTIFIGNKKIDNKFDWHHEVQYRNYDMVGDLEQLLLRTGLGMKVGTNANALLGYGYIRSENYIDDTDKIGIDEHRIFQQFIMKQNVGSVRFQHRYRFEQRFVEGDFRLRGRYFLGINVPLWKSEGSVNEVYASVYDEVFLNTVDSVFDRNRLYGALGYKLSSSVRLELGYMMQFLNNLNRDQLNLVCFLNW